MTPFYIICEGMKVLHQLIFNSEGNEDDEEEDQEEGTIELLISRASRRVNLELRTPTRVTGYIERVILNSTNVEFQSHLRVSTQTFEWLLRTLQADLDSDFVLGRPNIEARKQLLSILWLLGTPDSYRSVGDRFDMGKASVYSSFVRVIHGLNKLAPRIICWPSDERKTSIKNKFSRLAGFHGVVGAIDGTYVPIKAPVENPQAYVNRKCFHGITLQAICDADRKFLDCFTGYPSSVSDMRVFRNSDFYKTAMEDPRRYFGENEYIIGDKAYPILAWCIRPYINRGNLLQYQVMFNTAHAQTRQVIERAFALLFGRLRRLRYLDMNRTDLIPATIIACCVIHNICLDQVDDLQEQYEQEGVHFVQGEFHQAEPEQNMLITALINRNRGIHSREAIAREVYRNRR